MAACYSCCIVICCGFLHGCSCWPSFQLALTWALALGPLGLKCRCSIGAGRHVSGTVTWLVYPHGLPSGWLVFLTIFLHWISLCRVSMAFLVAGFALDSGPLPWYSFWLALLWFVPPHGLPSDWLPKSFQGIRGVFNTPFKDRSKASLKAFECLLKAIYREMCEMQCQRMLMRR